MSDEEDYNSEEDADYVPSEGDQVSEEDNSGDEEDFSALTGGEESLKPRARRKAKNKNQIVPRRRAGGIKLNSEESQIEKDTTADTDLVEALKKEGEEKKEEIEKKKADNLWSSFLTDVKAPPKRQPPSSAGLSSLSQMTRSHTQPVVESSSKPAKDKIRITKVFDFAGEEVRVTREVDVNSKEAKDELINKTQREDQQDTPTLGASSSLPGSGVIGLKRPAAGGGLGNVLSKIGKKQKMGTLDKSKLDWETFKQKEGITEDLKNHNKGKDGYIERMAFLNRTDLRQFEIEKEVRLKKSGKR